MTASLLTVSYPPSLRAPSIARWAARTSAFPNDSILVGNRRAARRQIALIAAHAPAPHRPSETTITPATAIGPTDSAVAANALPMAAAPATPAIPVVVTTRPHRACLTLTHQRGRIEDRGALRAVLRAIPAVPVVIDLMHDTRVSVPHAIHCRDTRVRADRDPRVDRLDVSGLGEHLELNVFDGQRAIPWRQATHACSVRAAPRGDGVLSSKYGARGSRSSASADPCPRRPSAGRYIVVSSRRPRTPCPRALAIVSL